MYGYRKEKGWSGKTYYVQMSNRELDERRKLKMVFCVPMTMVVMTAIFCFAAGIIR